MWRYFRLFEQEDPARSEAAGAFGVKGRSGGPEESGLKHSDVDEGEEIVRAED